MVVRALSVQSNKGRSVFTTRVKTLSVVMFFFATSSSDAQTYYYNQDIKALFQTNCSSCHNARSGANVPDWLDYQTAFNFSSAISTEVTKGTMPPGGGISSTDAQKIIAWVSGGALQDAGGGNTTGGTTTGTTTGGGTTTGAGTTTGGSGTTTGGSTTGGGGITCTHYGEYLDSSTNTCKCPPNYELLSGYVGGGSICTPKNPTYSGSTSKTDFFQSPGDASYNGYPSCGPNRIAIASNNVPYDISSSYYPNSSVTSPSLPGAQNPGLNYSYAQKANAGPTPFPVYLYPHGSRCACTYQTFGGTSLTPLVSIGHASTVVPAIPADHYIAIMSVTSASQHTNNPIAYSPVAIDLDPTGSTEGRQGSEILAGTAQCGCPNLNEVLTPTSTANLNIPQGAYCRSIFADPATGIISDKNVVLVIFNPTIHDVSGSSQVQNRSSEPQDSGKIISKIALPASTGSIQTQTYSRRIWTCASGYVIDPTTSPATCTQPNAVLTEHQCSNGAAGGLPSAVSSSIGGPDPLNQFNNAVNKKLSCCMHDHTKGYQNFKFDCIDNSALGIYHDFDELWTKGDSANDGGQLNAVVLSNASGKLITGFYTLDGKRCDQYSEFGDQLYVVSVNPKATATPAPAIGTWQVTPPAPPSPERAMNTVGVTSGLGIPSTAAQRLACPLVVRAAITAHCSTINPPLPAVQTYYKNGTQNRCTAADKITVYLQIKQVTEIVGKQTMKTFDAFMSPASAIQFDVGKIIAGNNAGQCPDGATRVGSQCVYQ